MRHPPDRPDPRRGRARPPRTARRPLLRLALACLAGTFAAAASAQDITGAGSTFVQPLLNRWSQDYRQGQRTAESQPIGSGLDYEPVGSQAGVMRLKDRAVDFAATEVPLSDAELTTYAARQFPVVVGGIVVAVNLEGAGDVSLRLTGEVLADIYLGRITTWADPAIAALNPERRLPDARIVPVRRADGSGTTFAFTGFLERASPAWSAIGSGQSVAWPVGRDAKGNDGVAEAVRATPNAIGYVDYASARRAGLSMASLRNGAGRFVDPGPDAFRASAAGVDWGRQGNLAAALARPAGAAAYPIVTATFVVAPATEPPGRATAAALAFFAWCLEHGSAAATGLGYVPLPPSAAVQARAVRSAPAVGGR